MIGHPGIAERQDVEKSENRNERAGENQKARERSARAPRDEQQQKGDSDNTDGIQKLPPLGPVEIPARIAERETDRKENLDCVKQKCAPRQQNALHESQIEVAADGTDISALYPCRENAHGDRN